MQNKNVFSAAQKNTARLAQLLLFSAGNELKSDLMTGTGLDSIEMRRYGGQVIYQSEWAYYKTLIDIASKKPSGIINVRLYDFIRQSGKELSTYNRGVVSQLSLSLPTTTIVVKNKVTDTIIISESLLDHFSIDHGILSFSISSQMIEFWLAGDWDSHISRIRSEIGTCELALWLYSYFLVMPGKITPPLDTLMIMSATKICQKRNFLQHAKRAVAVINKRTSLNYEIGRNKNGKNVIAFRG